MTSKKQLLVLILNKEEYLESILSLFIELDITGATIVDSVGMGRVVAYDIPIFAGFRDLMVGNRPYNKTIFSLVDEEVIPKIISGLSDVCADMTEQGNGLIFTLPVNDSLILCGKGKIS